MGEWHAAKAFLPPAISFKMPAVVDTRRDRKEGVSNAQNLWAHHERLDLSSELGSAPDVLRGSKGASDWIRSVGLEDGGVYARTRALTSSHASHLLTFSSYLLASSFNPKP